MTMFPSACIWTYRIPLTEALHEIKQAAFHYVDIETENLDVPGVPEALKKLGLKVSCVALDHNLPDGCSLEGSDRAAQQKAVDYIRKGLERSQAAGARVAYVACCRAGRNLNSFGARLKELADEAAARSIRLCVQHVPGSALGTARETLAFLDANQHHNLHLLLDTGHALISREKCWEIVCAAGNKLGYIQMDDNDGKSDRHWALLDGRMTLEHLTKTLEALQQIQYDGTLGLELNNDRTGMICGLSKNRNLLLRLQQPVEPKSLKEPESRRKP